MNKEVKINCDLMPIEKIEGLEASRNSHRFGRYSESCYWDIKGYGSKRWVVAARIGLDFEDDEVARMTKQEIIEGCMNHLNTVPPRKKYAKKKPSPKYGFLKCYNAKFLEKDGKKYISALLITEKRKNKLFWGKGKNV